MLFISFVIMFVIYNKCTFDIITNIHNQVMTNEQSTAHQIIHRSFLDIRINERLNTQFIAEVC